MKKVLFMAFCLLFVLTSCSNLEDVLPSSQNSGGSDDNSTSSSSSSSSSSSGVNISLSLVSQKAKDLVTKKYAGWSIKEAEKEIEHGAIQYKLTIVQGGNKKRLVFNANWDFLFEKN